MATRLWDSRYQDLLELVDHLTLTIIHKLCYFHEGTFTVNTFLGHHVPDNLVLNFLLQELTLIPILLFLVPSSIN